MITWGKAESFICGAIAIESSRVNRTGRSLVRLRRIASGMRGPCAARAKIKTVSPGATFPASCGASVTTPLTRPAPGAWAGLAICVFPPEEAPRQPRDHRLELLRAHPVRICAPGGLRQEGTGIADRDVDGERANRHGQTQCKRGGARVSPRVRRGVALADVGQQPRFDLAARLSMLVRGQGSGAKVGFELAQLIAVYRDIDRIARFARAQAAAQQRRHDEKQRAGDEHGAVDGERSHRRSASFPARSSAARLCSEAVTSKSCAGRRRRTRRTRTANPPASSSSGPNHSSAVVSLSGGRYREKWP